MTRQQPHENNCRCFCFANFLSNVVEFGFSSPSNPNTLANFITHFTGQQFQSAGYQTSSGNSHDGQMNEECISNADVEAVECLMGLCNSSPHSAPKNNEDQVKISHSLSCKPIPVYL